MKTLISYFILINLCVVSLYAESKEVDNTGRISTPIEQTNKLFEQYYYSSAIGKTLKAKKKLDKYVRKLSPQVTEDIKSSFYREIENALNLEYRDLTLKNITKYITLFPNDEKVGGLLNVQGYIYAEEGNWQQLEKTISDFAEYAKRRNQDWHEEIATLKDEYIKILYNEPFNKEVEGIWVSDSVSSSTHLPYYIFKIAGNGKVYLLKQSAFYNNELKNLSIDMNSKSQKSSLPNDAEFGNSINCTIDNDYGQILAAFASYHLNQGSEEAAAMIRDAKRRTQAAAEGAGARKGTVKAKTTGALISVATGLLGTVLSNEVAISSMYTYEMDVQMNKLHKNCLEASLTLTESKGRSNSPEYIKEKESTSKVILHKISSGDNVLFATKKGEPINLFSENCYNLSDIEQLNKIRKRTKLSRPQYLIPLILFYFPISAVIVNPIRKAKRRRNAKEYNKAVYTKILNAASVRQESLYYYEGKYTNE